MLMSTAPNRIKELREAAGLTLQELAEKLGTDRSQVRRLECGERRLTLEWMTRISEALGASLSELISPNGTAVTVVPNSGAVPRKLRSTEPPRSDLPPLGYVRLQIDQYVTPKQAEAVFEILKGAEA
jgi:transcriptional regulator with XRE-family HTH domain